MPAIILATLAFISALLVIGHQMLPNKVLEHVNGYRMAWDLDPLDALVPGQRNLGADNPVFNSIPDLRFVHYGRIVPLKSLYNDKAIKAWGHYQPVKYHEKPQAGGITSWWSGGYRNPLSVTLFLLCHDFLYFWSDLRLPRAAE